MPNWCDNSLKISGDKEAIDELYKIATTDVENKGFFNQILPRPVTEEENWYGWNVQNWGTKWDVCPQDFIVSEVRQENDLFTLSFGMGTAWSPPIALVIALCEKFRLSATLNYIEPGEDFVGKLVIEDGEVFMNECQRITKESLKYFGYDEFYIEDFFDFFEE